MQYLVDGNNLLHAVQAHGPGPPIGRVALCKLLARWGELHGVPVGVVFDGPAPRGGLLRQMRVSGVTVRFGEARSADEVIEDDIARLPGSATLVVVTTDRAIQHAARYHRAGCIDSEAFVRDLFAEPEVESPPPAKIAEKPESVSPEETEEWLREFGEGPDEPVDDAELWS